MGRALVWVVEGLRGEITATNWEEHKADRVTQADARLYVAAGLAEWVKEPASSRDKGAVRFLLAGDRWRGLSLKYGAYLAEAIRRREPWAVLMLSEIREGEDVAPNMPLNFHEGRSEKPRKSAAFRPVKGLPMAARSSVASTKRCGRTECN
jgi:hypothetical protein